MFAAPDWWFILSGVCFGISILFNIAFIVGGIIAWKKLSPSLTELQTTVRDLGAKGSDIAETARSTVENVHDRAEQILGSAQDASARVSQRVGAASAAITTLFVALRIFGYARGLIGQKQKPMHQIPAH